MNDETMTTDGSAPRRPRTWARTATLLGGGVLAGAMIAGVASANAATSTPTPSTSTGTGSSSSSTSTTTPPKDFNPGGSTPVRSDEKSVSSTISATLTEKALAKVSGGTVIRVETDAGDAAYEVHMKKADGTLVTVKFDKDLTLTAVEDGMGTGDPAPAGSQGAAPAGAPSGSSSATTTG